MIDLQKEFRTLRLLSAALLIIGAGLTLGGFGAALMTRDTSKSKRPQTEIQAPPETAEPASPEQPDSKTPVPVKEISQEKLATYTSKIGFSTGIMGLLFLGLGYALRWIIRNNIDDVDDGEVQMSDELFKAYADQLALAELRKQQNRKKMKLG